MNIGELDRRIQVLKRGHGKNTLGERQTGLTPDQWLWAKHSPVSDGERLRAGKSEAVSVSRFVVRYGAYSASITHQDRLSHDSAEWRIVGIKELGRRRWIEFTAEKVT